MKKSFSYFIVGGYVLGVLASVILRGQWAVSIDLLGVLGLVLGGFFGWGMVWFDRVAYVYILHPEAQLSQYVNFYIKKKEFKKGLDLLNKRSGEMDKLTTRSALFQVAWVVLAVFTLTSIAGWFGKMLVMGLGLHILVDEWQEYLKDKIVLKKWLFWQVQREVSNVELKWYLYGMTGLFAWLTLVLV